MTSSTRRPVFIEGHVQECGVRGEFGPCVLTRNAEHRCHGVIAEGDERALMLPLGQGM